MYTTSYTEISTDDVLDRYGGVISVGTLDLGKLNKQLDNVVVRFVMNRKQTMILGLPLQYKPDHIVLRIVLSIVISC
jgi:hypothetical protein